MFEMLPSSPVFPRKAMPFLSLKPLMSSCPRVTASSRACCLVTGSLTGTFTVRTWSNQSINAVSTSAFNVRLTLLPSAIASSTSYLFFTNTDTIANETSNSFAICFRSCSFLSTVFSKLAFWQSVYDADQPQCTKFST